MALIDHLEKLRYFYAVASHGSFNEAAKVLNITQPSVTKSVKILEETLEVPLFIRLPRGVALTDSGDVLFKYCHSLYAELEDVESKVCHPEDPMTGYIRVGTYDSIGISFWPKFLPDFFKRYPNIDLELTTERSHSIQTMVDEGRLDIGLIIEPKPTAESYVVDVATDVFKVYGTRTISKKGIDDSTSLIFMPDAISGGGHQRLSADVKEVQGFKKLFRTSSLESTKELIASGVGVGLLPERIAQDTVKSGRLQEVSVKGFAKKGIGRHQIGMVISKSKRSSAVIKTLVHEVLDAYIN